MKRFLALVLSGLVTQSVVAQSLSGYVPETVEEACAQIDEGRGVAACRILPTTEKTPYRLVVTVSGQQYAAAYTLAAVTLGTISCKTQPTVITFGITIAGTPSYRRFDMWCSPADRNVKLLRGWRTATVNEMRQSDQE